MNYDEPKCFLLNCNAMTAMRLQFGRQCRHRSYPKADQTFASTIAPASAVDHANDIPSPSETPPLDTGSAQNMQDRKLAFLNGKTNRRTVSTDRIHGRASPYVVQVGSVIPAALITGIKIRSARPDHG